MYTPRLLKPLTAMIGGLLATSRISRSSIAANPAALAPTAPSALGATIARRRGKGRDFSIAREKTVRVQPHGKMRVFRSYQAEERTSPEC